jgi:putative ABC transport system ATP-binding protein
VVITHNAPIASIADRVLTLGDGRLVREERNRYRAPVESVKW